MIWKAVIFGAILFLSLGCVLVSFVFLYQRKKYKHKQEVKTIRDNFTQEMLNSKAEIQEQTLQHIASEIHDNFSPTLSVINLNLAQVLPAVQEPAKETIIDTKNIVKQLIAEMKALSGSLNTAQLSRIGFVAALEQYVGRIRKTGFYEIQFTRSGDIYRLPANKSIILIRMCQEAINNILNHAEATRIIINLDFKPGLFIVTIADNGKGFDPAKILNDPDKQDSTGLNSMRNRATAIEATLEIISTEGEGTIVQIKLPV